MWEETKDDLEDGAPDDVRCKETKNDLEVETLSVIRREGTKDDLEDDLEACEETKDDLEVREETKDDLEDEAPDDVRCEETKDDLEVETPGGAMLPTPRPTIREKMQKNTSDPDAGNLAKGQKSVPKKKVPSGNGNGENGKRENHTQLHHAPAGTPQQSDTRQVRRLIWCKVRKSFIQQVPPAVAALRLEIETRT